MAARRKGSCNWLTRLAAAWFAAILAGSLSGQDRPHWKTGPLLRQQLDASTGITWGERPVREGLANLAKTSEVSIFLDRRLDPDQKIDLKLADASLQTVLDRIADRLQGGTCLVGAVVYLGPKGTSGKLATLAAVKRQEVGKLPAEVKARLLKSEAWRWDELAEPRRLLEELATKAGVKVHNGEQIPHDLWPAADWPAMPWTDRLTLLLAGFGLSFEVAPAGADIRLISLPSEIAFEKSYSPRGEAGKTATDLKRIVPDAKIVVEAGQLRVFATAEDHDKIENLLGGRPVKTTKVVPGTKKYTLTVENQAAGNVVKTIANSLDKEMKYDPALSDKLQQKITIVFKDVTLEELLDKTLKPLGLTYRIDETSLTILEQPK